MLPFFLICRVGDTQSLQSDTLQPDPNIKTGKLSNGLIYYILKNRQPQQKVELRLVVNAGSILEDDDQLGLAHFTEHMGFKSMRNFKKKELVSSLQSIGMKFGPDVNANTGFDETVYLLHLPTDKKENLGKGLLILEDWAGALTFEDSLIDQERNVVLEELRLGQGANDRMNKVLFPKLFEGSKYAQRLPIGNEDVLKTFKYESVRRFYKDWYRPDLMAVIVVGDINPAEIETMIREHFKNLKNPAPERARTFSEVKARQKNEAIIIPDKEATNSMLRVYYSVNTMAKEITVGDYRKSIVKNLFQSLLSQRLQERVQNSNPPFVYGGSNLGGLVRGYEAFSSYALLGKAGIEPAVTALVQEDERVRKLGFTDAELDRTKKNIMKWMKRRYNERDKTESGDLAEDLVGNFLQNQPIPGIEKEYGYYQQFLETISLEEINEYSTKAIPSSGGKLIVLTCPEKPDFAIPTSEQLLAWVDRATKMETNAYTEKKVATSLMTSIPASGKIVSENENKDVECLELNLSNGIKIILKSTDFKNDQIVMSGFRFGGQYAYGTGDRYAAEFAVPAVMQMGLGPFSPNDLRKVLAGKTVIVTPHLGTISEGFTGQCSADDMETLLQLLYLYFTQPRKDDELFRSFMDKEEALYRNIRSDPQTVFKDSVLSILYQNHPRAPKTPSAEIFAKMDEQRALTIYRERFGNANGFTFIFVGKIDIPAIKPLLAIYLGSLPSTEGTPSIKDVGLRPVRGIVKKEIHSGTDPKSLIVLQFTGEAPFTVEEQLRLQAVVEILNLRIIEKLREDLGGIYGGSISGLLSKYPYSNYSVRIALPCSPANVDKLLKATLYEIRKIKTNGPKEIDLNKVKQNWKEQYMENIKNNAWWVRQLQLSFDQGFNPADILSYEKNVNGLSLKDVQDAANRYLDESNIVQVILYPDKVKQP